MSSTLMVNWYARMQALTGLKKRGYERGTLTA